MDLHILTVTLLIEAFFFALWRLREINPPA